MSDEVAAFDQWVEEMGWAAKWEAKGEAQGKKRGVAGQRPVEGVGRNRVRPRELPKAAGRPRGCPPRLGGTGGIEPPVEGVA